MEGLQTMYTETISLSSIDAVKKFVCIANEYDFTINLLSDKYKIDAKSIMSVFSLDLSKPIDLNIHADGAALDNVMQIISKYTID